MCLIVWKWLLQPGPYFFNWYAIEGNIISLYNPLFLKCYISIIGRKKNDLLIWRRDKQHFRSICNWMHLYWQDKSRHLRKENSCRDRNCLELEKYLFRAVGRRRCEKTLGPAYLWRHVQALCAHWLNFRAEFFLAPWKMEKEGWN